MGSGRFDAGDWKDYSTSKSYDTKSTEEIFSSSGLQDELNPRKFAFRESRDSNDNPAATPILLALDVTGSMGMIADTMARQGIPTLCTQIYDRKPVTDPHIACMGIGDVEWDSAPVQVTQFEADIRISEQLEKIYLEHGGGGNSYESYGMAHYYAAMHTRSDAFEKRGKKGYLFTIGDEGPMPVVSGTNIERFLGTPTEKKEFTATELLTMASRQWEVFHIVVAEGSHCRHFGAKNVMKQWQALLGQRVILLEDYTKLAEVIVSAIQVSEGANPDDVVKSWDGTTALVVKTATSSLVSTANAGTGGVVTL